MSESKKKPVSLDILKTNFQKIETQIDELIEQLQARREDTRLKLEALSDKRMATEIYPEHLETFLQEPWVIIPKKRGQFYVIIPKFVKLAVGYPDFSTRSFNVFLVSKYSQWFSEIPQVLKQKLKFPEPLPLKIYGNMLLTGPEHQDKALNKYRKFLFQRKGKDRIQIKKGWLFKLQAQLIEDGILPFTPMPVIKTDLRSWTGEGYEFYKQICKERNITGLQDRTWKEFLQRGALGIFWAFSAGKSLFGHRIIGNIKGRHLVVVPGLSLKQQWKERIEIFNPKHKDEVRVETYQSYEKVKSEEWTTVMFDECHRLPAKTYMRLSNLKMKYRLGFSGSPFREDGRENFIIALTGFPRGMNWNDLLNLQIVRPPTFRLYVVKDKKTKEVRLESLLRLPLKTLIFCDSLDYGEYLAKKFAIPFVQHATPEKDRLEIIRNSDVCIASRVADQGISIQNLERSIEVAFLFGSRAQESQRFGRLMHSEAKQIQHVIIMTEKELQSYGKRLDSITQRGFKIEYMR